MASGNAGNFQSIPALYPDDAPIPTTRGSLNLYLSLVDGQIYTVDFFKVHRAVGGATAAFYPNSVATGTPTEGVPSSQVIIVTVDRSGYNDLIDVSATNLPTGVFLPDFTIPANTNRVTPTLTTDATTVAGNYNFTLNYRKAGSVLIYASIQVILNIAPPGPS